ncbi:response regulator [Scytonema sp. UIC 10036]|nr:response regulator [Scytonema sp. UIC 10036]
MGVLIVDDEADMRELVAKLLEDLGATVTVASSAAEALTALQQQTPDLRQLLIW